MPFDSSVLQFSLMAGSFIVDINCGLQSFTVISGVCVIVTGNILLWTLHCFYVGANCNEWSPRVWVPFPAFNANKPSLATAASGSFCQGM